jgi:hypothetical protein
MKMMGSQELVTEMPKKSSGKYKTKHPFNPIQIKDGMIVRLRKDGTVKAVLGKYGEYKKEKNK